MGRPAKKRRTTSKQPKVAKKPKLDADEPASHVVSDAPTQPADSADEFQDASLQPVVAAKRIDPEEEKAKLMENASMRHKAAQRLLNTVDLSKLLQSAPPKVDISPEDDRQSDENTEPAGQENTDQNKNNTDEAVETREKTIGSALILDDLTTAGLRKEIVKTRKRMNTLVDLFTDAYNECLRFRNEYYDLAKKQAGLSDQVHMRETLKVTGRVQRPLTSVQDTLLSSKKLRSGQQVKNARPLDEYEKYDFAVKDYTHEALRKIQLNANDRDPREADDSNIHHHTKKGICLMQQFEERCYLCGKYFSTKRGLQSHLTKHTEQFYFCKFCSVERKFSCQRAFKRHTQWHAKGEVYHKCNFVYPDTQKHCTKKFESASYLTSHMKSHYPPTLECRVHENCAAIYTYQSELKKHELKGVAKKIFECTPCARKFKDAFYRKIHMMKYHHPTSQYYISPAYSAPIIQRSKTGSATVPPASDVTYTSGADADAHVDDQTQVQAMNEDETATQSPGETENNAHVEDTQPSQTNKRQRKQSKPSKNFAVNDPELVIPLTHETSPEPEQDTTVQSTTISMSTGSEYAPSEHEARHAYDSDHDDTDKDETFLPDV